MWGYGGMKGVGGGGKKEEKGGGGGKKGRRREEGRGMEGAWIE